MTAIMCILNFEFEFSFMFVETENNCTYTLITIIKSQDENKSISRF